MRKQKWPIDGAKISHFGLSILFFILSALNVMQEGLHLWSVGKLDPQPVEIQLLSYTITFVNDYNYM